MKVVFLNPQQEMGGIQCLSAFLKRAGHRTALVNDPNLFDNSYVHFPALSAFFEDTAHILGQLEAERPDLVALPAVTDDYKWALKWARRIKERMDVPVVFGNVHPTFHSEETLRQDCVDYVVRGEGELTLLELVEALEGKRRPQDVPGLGYKENGEPRINTMRPLIEDLDTLPFPDKDLYYGPMPYLNFGYTTMTGRGCPYRCTFCDNNTSMKLYRDGVKAPQRWTRRHSPEYVVKEILWARERYGITHVRFNDEDFSYDKRWVRRFCALYREKVKIPYSVWVYPNTIDRETAGLMAGSGCDTVEMGIQSGSERLRRELLHRNTSDEQIVAAMKALDEAGIKVKVDVILGLPSETKADLDATVRLLARGRIWNVFAFWLRYYPATEILALARDRRLLTQDQLLELEKEELSRNEASPDTPAAGFWVPDLRQGAVPHRYLSFIVLLPILPGRIVDLFLRRDLIRFFPGFLNAFLMSNLTQTLHRDPTGEFRVRGRRLLLAETARLLKNALLKFFRHVPPAPKPVNSPGTPGRAGAGTEGGT
jgi:pyruvate-formate lyase-activating enzyme